MKILLRSLVKVLVISLVTVGIVALIGLIFRWQTAVQFSDGLFWAGAALAGVGILGAFGDKDMNLGSGSKFFWASPQERQTRLAGAENPQELVKRSRTVVDQGFNSYLLLFISAALIILIGYLVTVIFSAS